MRKKQTFLVPDWMDDCIIITKLTCRITALKQHGRVDLSPAHSCSNKKKGKKKGESLKAVTIAK